MRENSQMLLTFIRASVLNRQLVDETFQETMLIAWQKLDSFDLDKPFGPWLRGIAKNVMLQQYRKTKHENLMSNHHLLDYIDEHVNQIDKYNGDSWEDKVAPLKYCLTKLPNKYQQTIEARYTNQQKLNEVENQLSISSEALKKQLQRARKMLFECIIKKMALNTKYE